MSEVVAGGGVGTDSFNKDDVGGGGGSGRLTDALTGNVTGSGGGLLETGSPSPMAASTMLEKLLALEIAVSLLNVHFSPTSFIDSISSISSRALRNCRWNCASTINMSCTVLAFLHAGMYCKTPQA